MPRAFSSTEAAHAAGITLRQAQYWARTRLVVPSVDDAHGRGTHRRYNLRDVRALAVLGEFRQHGLPLQAMRRVQSFIRNRDRAELHDVQSRLVFAPGSVRDVRLVRSAAEIVSLLENPGQLVAPVVVDLARVNREVDARVVDIREARREREERKKKEKETPRAEVRRERGAA